MVAAILSETVVGHSGQLVIEEMRCAVRRPVKPAEDIEQGGFTRARGPQKDNQLAVRYFKINAAQGMYRRLTLAVNLRDALCAKGRKRKIKFFHYEGFLMMSTDD